MDKVLAMYRLNAARQPVEIRPGLVEFDDDDTPNFGAITTMSLLPEQTYSGTVPIQVKVDTSLGAVQASSVKLTLGEAIFTLTLKSGETDVYEYVPGWNTWMRPRGQEVNPQVLGEAPVNYYCAVQAEVVLGGERYTSPLFGVYTGNYSYGVLPVRGWNDNLEWKANYAGTKQQWIDSHGPAIPGSAYATLENDPVHGTARKVVRVKLPDSAKNDSDQPTNSPRYQSSSPQSPTTAAIQEGHTYCVGYAIFVPMVNSAAIGSGGFPSVNTSRPNETNQHIAIFQKYGPQARNINYPSKRGSAFIIDANRHSLSEPADMFHMEGNQLNPGDPDFIVDFPYNRGKWIDIVIKVRESCNIKDGWIEFYLNLGDSLAVQPVKFWNGEYRLPRVTLWPDNSTPAVPPLYVDDVLVTGGSHEHRTDMQIYRSPTAYPEVTLTHTRHRIVETVEEADPRSYALSSAMP